jgi:hypothetical protein
MKRFIVYFLISYIIFAGVLMVFTWQDLRDSALLTGDSATNIKLWLEEWLFWQVNYAFFLIIPSLILALLLVGAQQVINLLRLHRQ